MNATARKMFIEKNDLSAPRASRPAFRVRVGFEMRAAYDDLRDAIRAGRMMKQDHPTQPVAIVDSRTGLFVIDFD